MKTPLNKWDIFQNLSPGNYLWGADVARTSTVVGQYVHVKPEYGMLAAGRTEKEHEDRVNANSGWRSQFEIYFVPTKKGPGSPLNWRKAVQADNRFFAKTESECWEIFDERVQQIIDWHKEKIESAINMGSKKLKEDNTPKTVTRTCYHAVRDLYDKFKPAKPGIVSSNEIALIRKTLEIDVRTDVELQDVRDVVVMLYGKYADNQRDAAMAVKDMDAMSAVTHVIDMEKSQRGMLV